MDHTQNFVGGNKYNSVPAKNRGRGALAVHKHASNQPSTFTKTLCFVPGR